MKRKTIVAALFYIIILSLYAQSVPDTLWTASWDGGNHDQAYSVQQTSDGGYILVGRSNASNDQPAYYAWLIKTDANGVMEWDMTYGDTYIDEAYVVKETSDGGFIIGGMSTAYGWAGEGWLIRTDSNGNIIWDNGFHAEGSTTADWDYIFDVIETDDGGFIACGYCGMSGYSYLGWVLKVDSQGDIVWNNTFGTQYWDRFYSIANADDGGYYLAGYTHVEYNGVIKNDGWLMKVDAVGDSLWSQSYGYPDHDMFRDMTVTDDGYIYLAGETELDGNSGYNAWLVKTDLTGELIWEQTYGSGAFEAIAQTTEGNLVMAGMRNYPETQYDGRIMKADPDGNVIWDHIQTGSNLDDMFHDIEQTDDGGYICAGRYNWGEYWLVKYDSDLNLLSEFTETFDNVDPPDLPGDWIGIVDVLISNTIAEISTSAHAAAPSQPNAVLIMNGLDGSNGQLDANAFVALVSPEVEISGYGATVNFWAQGGNELVAGVMTDPEDINTFTPVETFDLDYTFTEYSFDIDTPGDVHIVFKHANTSVCQVLFVDSVELYQLAPHLAVDNESLQYYAVTNNTTAYKTLTLINDGYNELVINQGDITISGDDASEFVLTEPDYPIEIPENTSYEIEICFTPSSEGEKNAVLSIEHNGSNTPVYLSLDGKAYPEETILLQTFDDVEPPALPDEWIGIVDVLISNTIAEIKTTNHALAPSQPNAVLLMNGLDGSNGQLDPDAFVALATPEVEIEQNGCIVTFWAQGNDSLVAGYMSDPEDSATFVPVETYELSSQFTEYSFDIETPGNTRVVFKHANNSVCQVLFVDQIDIYQVSYPEITVNPADFEVDIDYGDVITLPLTISNEGNGELEYAISVVEGEYNRPDYSRFVIESPLSVDHSGYSGRVNGLNEIQAGKEISHSLESRRETRRTAQRESRISYNREQIEIHHDSGYNDDGIGTNGIASWISAVRFTADELANYYGNYEIVGIKSHIRDPQFTNVTVRVWEGGTLGDPGIEVYTYDVTDELTVDDWSTHVLTTPIQLLEGNEYWLGYSIDATGDHPASVDQGPLVDGKGGWMHLNNNWQELPDVNPALDFNWCIRGLIDEYTEPWLSASPVNGTVPAGESSVVDITFRATDVLPGTTYTADLVIANNAGVPEIVPVTMNVGEEPIIPPLNLSAQIVDINNVQLEWEHSGVRALTGFYVYMNSECVAVIDDPATTEHSIEGLDGGEYSFYVTALYNDETESEPSNSVDIIVELVPPLNFQAQVEDNNNVHCSWEAPGGGSNITLYRIYRNSELAGEETATQFVDTDVPSGTHTYYATALYNEEFESESSDEIEIEIFSSVEDNILPAVTELCGNYPNPFNPETTISFALKRDSHVTIEIFNIKGGKVRTLVNGDLPAAYHNVVWDGRDNRGRSVSSGIFFYRMRTDEYQSVKKMIMMK